MPSLAGLVLTGRYRLEAPVGHGNFGEVWRAHDLDQDDTVAVKLYKGTVAVQDVLLESRILTRLRTHPNVVNIRNVVIQPPRPYMAMEYMPAGSVSGRIANGAASLLDAHRWMRNALQGLAHVHLLGILHRDLKPGNLLLADNGEAVISDFGLAESTVHKLINSELYLPLAAPEQLTGGPSTVQTDLWAAGCLLYRLLTGRHPFGNPADLDAIRKGDWQTAPQSLNPQIPLRLTRLLRRALNPDTSARFETAQQMLAALNEVPVRCSWSEQPCDQDTLCSYVTDTSRGRYALRCVATRKHKYEIVLTLDRGNGPRARERKTFDTPGRAQQRVVNILRQIVQNAED